MLAAHADIYCLSPVMSESGCKKKLVMVMRTLRLIKLQTVGGKRDEIPTILDHKDFLKNTEFKSN